METMRNNMRVTFEMTFATPQSNALLFLKLFHTTQHVMPFPKYNVKQNKNIFQIL